MKFLFPRLVWPAITIIVAVMGLAAPNARAADISDYANLDYTDPEARRKWLGNVNGNHFNSDVENLIRAQTGTLFGDIRYVLRTFPNHHRALDAMTRLYRRDGDQKDPDNDQLVMLSTFFQKAFQITPRDPMPHMIYAVHFHKLKEYDKALVYYHNALDLGLESKQLHNNLGLLYADIEDYEQSLYHARKAYEMGYPLPGLRNRLIKAGVWE